MPNEKVLLEKQQYVAELKEKLSNAAAGVLVDYKASPLQTIPNFVKSCSEAGVEYRVVKNTMLRLALKDTPYEEISSVLENTTAIATPTMIRSLLQKSSANTLKITKTLLTL